MVGESKVGEDTDTELGVEVADITHIAHEGEVELVALADGRCAAEEVEELTDDGGIWNASVEGCVGFAEVVSLCEVVRLRWVVSASPRLPLRSSHHPRLRALPHP